ncbi:MAG: ScyD/ScyE family protein [Candidatus Dormibacteraeota bacterium]|nr:ScyD/ScyE family protein [Candidatus Dormibacteraeota bacterium]
MRLSKRYLVGLLVVAIGALVPTQASASSNVTTVAWGLDSPRGIGFLDGRMVVAEAGHGGKICLLPSPVCLGGTSRLTWVNPVTHMHSPLVKGLLSVHLGGPETIGVSGFSVANGKILAIIGAGPQLFPPGIGIVNAEAGRLISVEPDGDWQSVAAVGTRDYNFTLKFKLPTPGVYSPGTQEHDTNPYGVLATANGAYVADAGSNTLDWVDNSGNITILHHFEWRDPNPNNFPNDTVPTCVAPSGGNLWVAQLSGRLIKLVGGTANLVTPKDAKGMPLLTHVTNCISDRHGNLYFVNMFGPGIPFTSPSFFVGNVVKYNPVTGHGSVVAGNLSFPNMAAWGPDGNLYVTTGSICPANGANPFPPPAPNPCVGGGKVVRINLHD